MAIVVRKLKRKDRVTLAKLIKKFADVAGTESLVNMVPTKAVEADVEESEETTKANETAEILETAFGLLEQMLSVIDSDMADWFCDLTGINRDEYDDQEFDIEVQILEQIVSQKGFESFFSRGSQVVSRIKKLAGPFQS
jgi:hypothetical protein